MSILTAFGFTQFAEVLPDTHIKTDRQLIVSPHGALRRPLRDRSH